MAQDSNPQIEAVNFDGDRYAVDDLTPRVLEGFNMLVRLQQDVQEQAYQLRKSQGAQTSVSAEIKSMIKEDKVKPLEDIVIDDTSTE